MPAPSPLARRILEALEEKINESPDLPEHTTVMFKRPRAVMPDDCPLLSLFLIQKVFQAETNFYYDDAIAIGVQWQEEAVQEAQTLIDNPELAMSQLNAITAIERVIFKLAIDGLAVERVETEDGRELDNVYAIYPVGIDLSEPSQTDEGLVEGYAMTVEVDATETKLLS